MNELVVLIKFYFKTLVGATGFEPVTSSLRSALPD